MVTIFLMRFWAHWGGVRGEQPYLEPYHTPTHGSRDGDETCLPTTRATKCQVPGGGADSLPPDVR